jgi:hypothetical protein
MKEETLYDKRLPAVLNDSFEAQYRERDIKNFIKKLKETISFYLNNSDYTEDGLLTKIDKLAGSKLV